MHFSDYVIADEGHRLGLEWFISSQGGVNKFPAPLADGSLLATRGKGIYKPKGLQYALSIRIQMESKYPDGEIISLGSNGWGFAYHEETEIRDGYQPSSELFTNRGLVACMRDRVPVGVLKQIRGKVDGGSLYHVVGLAEVIGRVGDYFFLADIDSVENFSRSELVAIIATEQAKLDIAKKEQPDDFLDTYEDRVASLVNVFRRQGQGKFRDSLLKAYERKCAVTSCGVIGLLDAAHLFPYKGVLSNVTENGLLLRTDLHTLFDLNLLGIEPESGRITIHNSIMDEYYRSLEGIVTRVPILPEDIPSQRSLAYRWELFQGQSQA